MFERVWNYIKKQFQQKQVQQHISAVPFAIGTTRQHVIRPLSLPRNIFGLHKAKINQQMENQERKYELVLNQQVKLPEEQHRQLQDLQLHADILQQMRELQSNFNKLAVADERVREADSRMNQVPQSLKYVISQSYKPQQQPNKKLVDKLKKDYLVEIQNFRDVKYTKEKSQYAPISFQQFKNIQLLWKAKGKTTSDIKTTNFECVQKLTYRALGGLDYHQWLNDDIINIYLEMLEKRFLNNSETLLKLLNSYFATNILAKTQTQIQRFLKKKSFSKSDRLIMPINNKNHWYFAIFDGEHIVVYDSMKQKEQSYKDNPIFKNAVKFAKMFYQRDFTVKVCINYPQQNNHYDCGVFMLMGVRDTLRSKQWSYHQADIRFKRVQIASEILKETLIFTQ